MRAGVSALLLAAALSTTAILTGCSDKSAAATPDAAAVLPNRGQDAGPDASRRDGSEAALEDTAMPASSGEDLQVRMRHLFEAITQNNPDLASDALFPRDAYVGARDAVDPLKAWEKAVSDPFRKAVERTHRRTRGVSQAKFVSFEVGRSIVQVTPKKKEFKKPLWRVKHSKLTFMVDGKTRTLEIPEMTAWRGAWYVTRLR